VNRIAVNRLSYIGSTAGFLVPAQNVDTSGGIRFTMLRGPISFRNSCYPLGGNVKNRVIESSSVPGSAVVRVRPACKSTLRGSLLLLVVNTQDRPGVLPVLPQVRCLRL